MRKGFQGPLARSKNTPPPEFHYDPPSDNGLNILHQDNEILVVSKPTGLLSVPGKSVEHFDSMETRVQHRFPTAGIVHRLDRGTSGVFIFALTPKSHRHLGLQFERRRVKKTYTALVFGTVEADQGKIELSLRTDWYNRPKQVADSYFGREAITRWEVIDRHSGFTRIRLWPETGRSHQLRVHMQELGHPILGDSFYGSDEVCQMAERLMLHAESIELHHPKNGERTEFTDPSPF